jgi:hypothetical protein
LVNGDAAGSVFDSNIRRFLGTRGAVNADILKTCVDAETSHQFWFLNNGITIVCDSFDAVTVPDDAHIKIKNMQIVNGCQTATTLALAERRGELAPDVRVLLRICEATDSELVGKIVLTTNNQNKISSRDLRANDPIQADMERGFAKYNYFYERKLRQHDNQKGVAAKRIIANDTVAQSYLAVVLKTPSDAYGRKYKVWGELFNKIFGGGIIEPYVIAVQIYRHCLLWIGLSGYTKDADDVRRKLANSAAFHISRITSFYWRGGDDYKVKDTILQAQIETLEHNPQILDPHIENAFDLLENIIRTQPAYQADLDRTLKSSQLDADIDRALHSRQSRNQKPKTKHRHSPEQPQFEL